MRRMLLLFPLLVLAGGVQAATVVCRPVFSPPQSGAARLRTGIPRPRNHPIGVAAVLPGHAARVRHHYRYQKPFLYCIRIGTWAAAVPSHAPHFARHAPASSGLLAEGDTLPALTVLASGAAVPSDAEAASPLPPDVSDFQSQDSGPPSAAGRPASGGGSFGTGGSSATNGGTTTGGPGGTIPYPGMPPARPPTQPGQAVPPSTTRPPTAPTAPSMPAVPIPPVPVPEPRSLFLLAAAVAGLALIHLRRR